MLLTARVPPPRAAPAPASDARAVVAALAGHEFGKEFFYGGGSSTEVYAFFANGTVTKRSMSSFTGTGDADGGKRGRFNVVGTTVQMTFDGAEESATLEISGGKIEAILFGSARYRRTD